MNPEDELDRETINMIAWNVRDKKANQDDVKKLLNYFCRLVDEGEPIPGVLREFLRDGFRIYLDNNANSVDQGLGLIRTKRGNTGHDQKLWRKLAAKVLAERVAGKTREDALEDVGEEKELHASTVRDAWKLYKGESIPYLLKMREHDGKGPFTTDETKRLKKIFRKDYEEMSRFFAKQPPTISTAK